MLSIGFVAAYAAGIVLALLLTAIGWWSGAAWEQDMLHAAHRTVSPALDVIMLALPFFGTNYTLAPVVMVAAFVLWDRGYLAAASHLLIVQAGSFILNPALKITISRDRPALYDQRGQHTFSAFPSGHAMAVAAVMLSGAYLLHRYRRATWGYWVVVIFFLFNAYSRLYLSVHWPTDILAGAVVGLVWFFVCLKAFSRLHHEELTQRV